MEDVGADAGGQFAVFHFQIVFVKTETVVHVQILVRVGIDTTDIVTETPVFIITGSKTFFIAEFVALSKEYQESVIPTGSKVFGLTAGLPVNLEGLVGANGKVWGLESFGFSAPYKVLDEKLGFTGQNVYNQVKELLN